MIIDYFILAIFTSLVAVGIHSVTRDDKLLWFLGVRIHQKRKLDAKMQQKTDTIDERFLIYSTAIEDIELSDIEGSLKIRKQKDAEREYHKDVEKIEDRFDFAILDLENKIKRKAKQLHMRLLLPIAPALTECLICMSSFWSIVSFSLHYSGYMYKQLIGIPVVAFFFVFAVAGINSLATKILS